MAHFEKNCLIMLDAVINQSDMSRAWTDALAMHTTYEWFQFLLPFCSTKVRDVFRNDAPPTASGLCSLPYVPEYPGSYGDFLTPPAYSPELLSRLYNGCSVTRTVGVRGTEWRSPSSFKNPQDNEHYKVKHTLGYTSQDISFAVIPIDLSTMDVVQVGRRRMLCRISEAVFTVWTNGLIFSHSRAKELLRAVRVGYRNAYDIGTHRNANDIGKWELHLEWTGLATHSPLKETLGINSSPGTAVDGRRPISEPSTAAAADAPDTPDDYEDMMDEYAEICGGRQYVPKKLEDLASRRASESRKRKVTRGLKEGKYTQEQYDQASVNLWFTTSRPSKFKPPEMVVVAVRDREAERAQPGFHENKSFGERRSRFTNDLEAGKITQEEYDQASANQWYHVNTRSSKNKPPELTLPPLTDDDKKAANAFQSRRKKVQKKLDAGQITLKQFKQAESREWFQTDRRTKHAPKPVTKSNTTLPFLPSSLSMSSNSQAAALSKPSDSQAATVSTPSNSQAATVSTPSNSRAATTSTLSNFSSQTSTIATSVKLQAATIATPSKLQAVTTPTSSKLQPATIAVLPKLQPVTTPTPSKPRTTPAAALPAPLTCRTASTAPPQKKVRVTMDSWLVRK